MLHFLKKDSEHDSLLFAHGESTLGCISSGGVFFIRSKLELEGGCCRIQVFEVLGVLGVRFRGTMMKGGPLRVVATAGAAVAAGMFTLSMASSVSLGVLSTVVERQRKKTAPQCVCCKGRGFTECRLCKGEGTIDWSPLYDPVVNRPCVCPTCDNNKVQKCLNCVGKGYA